jgi:hypothetical protein
LTENDLSRTFTIVFKHNIHSLESAIGACFSSLENKIFNIEKKLATDSKNYTQGSHGQ